MRLSKSLKEFDSQYWILSYHWKNKNFFWLERELNPRSPVGKHVSYTHSHPGKVHVHVGAWRYLLGICQVLVEVRQYDRADENFKRAQELEPDNGNVYVHRGYITFSSLNKSYINLSHFIIFLSDLCDALWFPACVCCALWLVTHICFAHFVAMCIYCAHCVAMCIYCAHCVAMCICFAYCVAMCQNYPLIIE